MRPTVNKRFVLYLAVTTAFEGLRAGASVFRGVLDLPARGQIGQVAFAQFSRATDLSTRGLVYYALFGFGGALLTGMAWLMAARTKAPVRVRRSTAVAALLSLAILLLTIPAAPLMMRVGKTPDEPALLGSLLDDFVSWTIPRLVGAVGSFFAMLSALTFVAMRRSEEL
jgi:hypothetical protein